MMRLGFLQGCRRHSTVSRAVTYLKSTTELLTGHSDVLEAQKRVKQRKEELRRWRNQLSETANSHEETQQKLKNLYARKTQVYQEHKKNVSALQAINNEEETLLFQEQLLNSKLEECKQGERDCFESLSDTIQESHEKERAQSERMKYYSRLGSILGALLGFLGSNLFLRREIRQHIRMQVEGMDRFEISLQGLQAQLESKTGDKRVGSQEDFQGTSDKFEQHLAALGSSLHNLEGSLRIVEHRIEKAIASAEVLTHSRPLGGDSSQVSASAAASSRNSDLQVLGVVSFSAILALLVIKFYAN